MLLWLLSLCAPLLLCITVVVHHYCLPSLLSAITLSSITSSSITASSINSSPPSLCVFLHHSTFSSITPRFPPSLHVPITSSNNTIPSPYIYKYPHLSPPTSLFLPHQKPHNRHFQQCLIRTPVVVQSARQPTSPRSLFSCSIATTTSPLTTPPTKKQAVSEATSRPTFRTS